MSFNIRLFNSINTCRIWELRRVRHFKHLTISSINMVNYRWCCHNEIDVKLTFQTLLDNIHVKKTQETTTETKTKGLRGFRLKLKTGIVQLELFKSFTQVIVFIRLNWIKTGEDHWIHLLIAMEWLCCWIIRKCYCITDTGIRNSLD